MILREVSLDGSFAELTIVLIGGQEVVNISDASRSSHVLAVFIMSKRSQ
jgi:hypothetical protein